MEDRTWDILEASIADFIETGEPISSSWLFAHHNFGIRPAMIRWELSALEGAGYLEQPHHSAGRVPSNRGYEFFARRAFEHEAAPRTGARVGELFRSGAWEEMAREAARELEALSVVRLCNEGEMFKEGLARLIGHVEAETREEIRRIIADFENLDERLGAVMRQEHAAQAKEDVPEVYVGRSPITKSPQLSVVWETFPLEDRGHICFLVIGPRRMNYSKVADVFQRVEDVSRG